MSERDGIHAPCWKVIDDTMAERDEARESARQAAQRAITAYETLTQVERERDEARREAADLTEAYQYQLGLNKNALAEVARLRADVSALESNLAGLLRAWHESGMALGHPIVAEVLTWVDERARKGLGPLASRPEAPSRNL